MTYWTIPRIWEGVTCVIIGGGPSAADIDKKLLIGPKVIGVNDAYKDFPCHLAYWKDCNWYTQLAWKDRPELGINQDVLKYFIGLKVTSCQNFLDEPDIHVLRRGRRDHLERDPNFITHCGHAGAEALALAIMLGCRTILLAGFDMRAPDGKHNYHDNHTREIPESIYEDYFVTPFEALATDAEKLGVTIFNCTIGSALDTFHIVPMDEVLNADGSLRT